MLLSDRAYDPATLAWLAQLAVRPSNNWVRALDEALRGSRADGDLTELDRLWIFSAEYQAHARVSIINPTSTNITEVNSPTWTFNRGYSGDGATKYLRSNFLPSAGVKYTQASASFGVYVASETSGLLCDMGVVDSASSPINAASTLFSRTSTNTMSFSINSDNLVAGGSGANNPSRGLNSVGTIGGTMTGYRNGVSVGTSTNTNYSLATKEFYILANNSNGISASHSTRTAVYAFIGSGNVNHLRLHNRLLTFLQRIGAST